MREGGKERERDRVCMGEIERESVSASVYERQGVIEEGEGIKLVESSTNFCKFEWTHQPQEAYSMPARGAPTLMKMCTCI